MAPRERSVGFDSRGLDVTLAHADRHDWTISATVGDRDAIVGTSWVHEHFFALAPGAVETRPWTTQVVDFVAEILRGKIEIETTFRGEVPVSVTHFSLADNGQRHPLGRTGFLVPGRLLLWRPKRTETERVSFLLS